MVSLVARLTRRVGLAHIRHVAPVAPRVATGLVARVYGQIEADFGMLAPPIALHAPAPITLAAIWTMLRETLLASGLASREAKEAVAAAVSLANRCPYCVEVHGAALIGLVRGPDGAAIAAGRIDAVANPQLRALARWAQASGTREPGVRAQVPFAVPQAPELIGVAITFHCINRMVNVFLRDSPLPPVPGVALGTVRRRAVRIMGGLARERRQPGTSLDLLPDAPLPPDLSWAAGQPHVASALARSVAAIDEGGARAVPEQVRQLVTARLAGRTGEMPGISARPWLDEAVADLPDGQRPAGRLALLTAVAAYQVTDALVDEYRAQGHDDKALIELTAWSSLAAARQIGAELCRDLETLAGGA